MTTTPSASDSGLNLDHLEALSEQFEEWAKNHQPPYQLKLNKWRFNENSRWYDSERTQHTFEGFRAALARRAAPMSSCKEGEALPPSAPIAGEALQSLQRYEESDGEGGGVYKDAKGLFVKLEDVRAALTNQPAPTAGDATSLLRLIERQITYSQRFSDECAVGNYRVLCATIMRDIAEFLGDKSTQRAPAPTAAPEQVAALEGRIVSVDVSTGEDDALNRIYAELTGETASDGETLIAIEQSRNFSQPSEAAPEQVKKHYHELTPGDIVVAINGTKLDHPEYVVQGGGNDYLIFKSGYTDYGVSDSFTVDLAAPSLPAAAPAAGDELRAKCRYCGGDGEHYQGASRYAECEPCNGTGQAYQPAQEPADMSTQSTGSPDVSKLGVEIDMSAQGQAEPKIEFTPIYGDMPPVWRNPSDTGARLLSGAASPVVRAQSEESAVKPPRTAEEMVAFIGNHYNAMLDEKRDPADIEYALTVHDLLSAMSDWFDGEQAHAGADEAKPLAHGHRDDHFLLVNARRIGMEPISRVRQMSNWVLAMELFATGSTSAHQICRDAGIDPDSCTTDRAAIRAAQEGESNAKG